MSKSPKPSRPSGAEGADAEAAAVGKLRYEEALAELESLVERVEDGELALEEGIEAHRRAVLLLRHCEGILDAAQARVEQIGGDELAGDDDAGS